MRESQTFVLERNVDWQSDFVTEPWECGWATEAIFFARILDAAGMPAAATAAVQISPDGMHWCDEGTRLSLPAEPGVTHCCIRHFGGWLRLSGQLPAGARLRVIVYLALKE